MLRTGLFLAGFLYCTSSFAATVTLADAFVFLDGTFYELGVTNPPANVDLSAFSPTSFGSPVGSYNGIGTITVSFVGAGSHNVAVYYDHDINLADNGSFNEYGVVNGVAPTGFSWQLGDPNDTSGTATDIFTQASKGTLTNANTVGTPNPPPGICCDVAMAEGISVNLAANQRAVLTFVTSMTAPTGGFYLSQFDVPGLSNATPDLAPGDAVYLKSSLNVITTVSSTPEPGTIALLLSGLGVITLSRTRRRA